MWERGDQNLPTSSIVDGQLPSQHLSSPASVKGAILKEESPLPCELLEVRYASDFF